ncbi:MAG: peptidoglycan endopeptidase, partial [Stenotrophomonas indicatrix]
MRLVDVERWVGIPYDEAACDCADLVVQVQRALFAREVALPGRRPRGR